MKKAIVRASAFLERRLGKFDQQHRKHIRLLLRTIFSITPAAASENAISAQCSSAPTTFTASRITRLVSRNQLIYSTVFEKEVPPGSIPVFLKAFEATNARYEKGRKALATLYGRRGGRGNKRVAGMVMPNSLG